MEYKLLSLKDRDIWNNYLRRLPLEQQDVYFTPEYYRLYEKNGDGVAYCFVYEEDDDFVLYPFLKNSINSLGYDLDDEYYDIQGAYGYNGILSTSLDINLICNFTKTFNLFCVENNIVAEFLRLNPIINNLAKNRFDDIRVYDRDNVYVDLSMDLEDIVKIQYEHSTRKNIKKALKYGLECKFFYGKDLTSEWLQEFYSIYTHTMDRNSAESFYYFSIDYFRNIAKSIGDNSLFIFVLFENKVISCELVMLGSCIAYSFLGGTYSDYYVYRPNDFLKHKINEILICCGCKYFLLGGGSDGILRYKKSFSKEGVITFYISKKIHHENIYSQILDQWKEKYPDSYEKNKVKLLGYREI